MVILSVNKFFWPKGGSEAVFLGEKSLLEERGHTVVPFSMRHTNNLSSPYERFFVDNVDYGRPGLVQKLSAASKVLFSFEARRKMNALLSEIRPDLAHFHIFQHQISPSIFGPLRKAQVPIVLTLHDLKPICPNYKMLTEGQVCERCKGRRFYNCLLHRCSKGSRANSLVNSLEMYLHYQLGYYQSVDRYIAVSRFYREKMIEFGFPPERVVYIPNFVDLSLHRMSEVDDGYALYFGRLSGEKGVMTLLDASETCRDIPLLLVGTGPLEAEVADRIATQGLSHVKCLGYKTGEELLRLIGESSFTVLPSEWYENCPMSVLESFARGKPVIGSRIGGIPELISDGEDGLTFDAADSDQLACQMRALWSDRERRMAMGRNARRKVEQHHSPEAHYEHLLSAYQSVL